jgi:hypothetical protein
LNDFHEALFSGFLMPTEVAACRSDPVVCDLLQRLLEDRWWAVQVPDCLESVPEESATWPVEELLQSEEELLSSEEC